jgi:hypothetical protein
MSSDSTNVPYSCRVTLGYKIPEHLGLDFARCRGDTQYLVSASSIADAVLPPHKLYCLNGKTLELAQSSDKSEPRVYFRHTQECECFHPASASIRAQLSKLAKDLLRREHSRVLYRCMFDSCSHTVLIYGNTSIKAEAYSLRDSRANLQLFPGVSCQLLHSDVDKQTTQSNVIYTDTAHLRLQSTDALVFNIELEHSKYTDGCCQETSPDVDPNAPCLVQLQVDAVSIIHSILSYRRHENTGNMSHLVLLKYI